MRSLAWTAAVLANPRWRVDALERLGLRVPPVQPGAIWVHASSVGEVGAALGLVAHLPDPVLLTASSDTGLQVAREAAKARPGLAVGPLPADHPWMLAPLWAEARPRALVLVESAWWPGLVRIAGRSAVPVLRVSATAGARTRGLPTAALRWWLRGATRIFARDATSAEFFAAHQDAPVEVGGDLKASRPLPSPTLSWARPFVVGASTRKADELPLLEATQRLQGAPQLLLAPRHPQRFQRVASALDRSGCTWVRRSALGHVVPPAVDVVLLDSVGSLAGELRGARAVLVGGTFDPALGGHSPLEAWRAGVPVVCGPETGSHREAFRACRAAVAPSRGQLLEALAAAVPPPAAPPGPGPSLAEAVLSLAGPPAPERSPRPWARPLAPIVAGAQLLRGRAAAVEAYVVAVGSDNARGSGKTTVGRWVARALAERGHVVGVVVRGYRRVRPDRQTVFSDSDATAFGLGDEGALYARDGHVVAAGPDRLSGALGLVQRGVTAIVLDDGLQQRHVGADLRVEVVDLRFPAARGALPAGERRWTAASHVCVALGGHRAGAITATRTPGPWHLGRTPAKPPTGPVAVFAGLPRPADFLAVVDAPVAKFRALPNHGAVDAATALLLRQWADGLPLVCSARDHVRLPEELAAEVWWRDQVVNLERQLPLPGVRS